MPIVQLILNPFRTLFVTSTILITVSVGCNTITNVYKSPDHKSTYLTINAVTLSHCGCTHLYADFFKNNKKEFEIFYDGNVASKKVYEHNNKKITNTINLLATNGSYTIAFDSLDIEIFKQLNIIANRKSNGIIYPFKGKEFKGYIKQN